MEIFDKRKYTYSDPYLSGQQFPLAIQRSLHPPCLPQNPHVDSQGPRGIFGPDLKWKNIVLEAGGLCISVLESLFRHEANISLVITDWF